MVNETADRIILGAADLFFEQGFAKVTMDEIARHTRLSKKTLYNHFPTKLALMASVIENSVQSILRGLNDIAADLNQDFLSKMERMMEFIYQELGLKRLNFFENFQRYYASDNEKPVQVIKERIISLIKQLIREAEEKNLIQPGVDKNVLPWVYLNMLYGLVELYKSSRVPVHPGELLVESLKITFFGILTAKGKHEQHRQEQDI